ncbi:ABC transporter ATP-binding protein [Aspergillus homomorphus CBS 101889]|uniref:Abc transporter n=1 Tax=Aspergillus homomorphus (strain CBS 101889) TaxID=1450537 RepID=A0A395IC09_ASPHC|nr:abc transporter [Aspergillus homomorphus CBS 101889]RAL17535.1 abc transporter [Aspergillus homomorphus CBS 101889]
MTLAGAAQLLHLVATVVTLLFVFGSFLVHYKSKTHLKASVLRKTVFRVILVQCISASYIPEAIILFQQRHGPEQPPDHIFAATTLALAWTVTCLRREILVSEALGLSLISLLFGIPGLILDALHPGQIAARKLLLTIESVRVLFVVGVLLDCLFRSLSQRKTSKLEEEEDLIPCPDEANGQSAPSQVAYGTIPSACQSADGSESALHEEDDCDSDSSDDESEDEGAHTSNIRKTDGWMAYIQDFKVFLPFLISRRDYKVQACLLVCILCLVADRVLNIVVPRQLGVIADKLFARELPYADLGIYLALNLLHNQSGLEMIVSLAKIPLKQFSYRQLTNAAFNHVLNLGMDFHSDRDSAEVMKALEQGESLTNLLEVAMLYIAPAIIDMFVAFVFLYRTFNSSAALCMLVATLAFTAVEVVTADWNVGNRRQQTKAERAEARVMHQAIQGWPTVFLFNMFPYERARFAQARDAYTTGLTEAFFPVTFAILALVVAREIQAGRASPGDFVFLVLLWEQLIWPIKYLSKDYRWLVSELVGAERLLDLLLTKPTVTDKPDAEALGPAVSGTVAFEQVSFSYPQQPRATIHDITYTAPAGSTTALVGATGAGKSSLTKLLLRQYDVSGGRITIDGRDVRDITQASLRGAAVCAVPQAPVLFNASILENLRYANQAASDEQVHAACRAAAIHDRIVSFPRGYHTRVGEQGVKLSGGEVQRLAIARAFLRDAPVLVLDEATSAVDSETEAKIQAALARLTTKRTTFVIAHRLSTVVRADQILVLHEGRIVERGTHSELLARRGRYYMLWQTQLVDDSEGGKVDLLEG